MDEVAELKRALEEADRIIEWAELCGGLHNKWDHPGKWQAGYDAEGLDTNDAPDEINAMLNRWDARRRSAGAASEDG